MDSFDNYVGTPGTYNVWRIENKEWKLMVDGNNQPLEFPNDKAADKFCEDQGFQIHPGNWKKIEDTNGLVKPHPTPNLVSDCSLMRLSNEAANQKMDEWNIDPGFHREIIGQLLTAENGGKQSQKWVAALDEYKSRVGELKKYPAIQKLISDIYLPGSDRSYHSALARLYCFYPISWNR